MRKPDLSLAVMLSMCLLVLLLVVPGPALADDTAAPTYPSPLIQQRADPWVVLHEDGYYYFTATVPEYDRLEVRRARTIEGLAKAEPRVVWRKHPTGEMGAHIWAPELHYIDGKWYIYFAAGGAEDVWAIRMYVLECQDPNPVTGEWVEKGQIKTPWESFSLDATTFAHRGKRYLAWAQHTPSEQENTSLYIAELENPWTLKGEPVRISKPDQYWEQIGYRVNEGPSVLIRHGQVFLTYSASATDANYCVGLLTADADADLLDPASWHKSPRPVFASYAPHRIFGPGHSCFTTTPDGKHDLLVYHARNYENIEGNALADPNRHTRVQVLEWNDDGTPRFGAPLPDEAE